MTAAVVIYFTALFILRRYLFIFYGNWLIRYSDLVHMVYRTRL